MPFTPSAYSRLEDAFKRCNAHLSKQKCQEECNTLWKKIKDECGKNTKARDQRVQELIDGYLAKASQRKAQSLLSFGFKKDAAAKVAHDSPGPSGSTRGKSPDNIPSSVVPATADIGSAPPPENSESTSRPTADKEPEQQNSDIQEEIHVSHSEEEDEAELNASRTYETPKQNEQSKLISVLESELNNLLLKRDAGYGDENTQKNIEKCKRKLEEARQRLKDLQMRATRAKRYRLQKKNKLMDACDENPSLAAKLKLRKEAGRPRIEVDQPDLLQTIVNIAQFGGSADDRRRSEIIRSCKTLDDLTEKLRQLNFQLSRSATYLRLKPRNHTTAEGKRHVATVNVRLCRAEANLHKHHPDALFCKETLLSVKTVCSLLGPQQAVMISQDDKARVPLGKTAAKAQAPLLMHMDYRVRLPDHDWVVGEGHKLIPSVYVAIAIKENGMGSPEAVTHHGPTYIAIRSAKHSSSTASTHAADFDRLVKEDSFQEVLLNHEGLVKPVLFKSVDGGPDESPRYHKVIAHAIEHFKKYDLDAYYQATNAPGRSAFNEVERVMAPLSRELSGLILPHDYYGSHLDQNGKTINAKLEEENFQKAGETLAEVWSGLVLDGHPVVAAYVNPKDENQLAVPEMPDPAWYSRHVRESQYFLQIAKCTDNSCCKPYRSNLRDLLPGGFIPAPYPLLQTPSSLVVPPPSSESSNTLAPLLIRLAMNLGQRHIVYDRYCPSLQEKIEARTCADCKGYFSSNKSAQSHRKGCHSQEKRSTVARTRPFRVFRKRREEVLAVEEQGEYAEWLDVDSVEPDVVPNDEKAEAVSSSNLELDDCLKSPWTEDFA